MLSQPRPAPKPVSEPPLSRLSHFVYNAGGNTGGGNDDHGDAAGQERQGTQGKEGGGVLARAVSDFGGTGETETGFQGRSRKHFQCKPLILLSFSASAVTLLSAEGISYLTSSVCSSVFALETKSVAPQRAEGALCRTPCWAELA